MNFETDMNDFISGELETWIKGTATLLDFYLAPNAFINPELNEK